MSRFTFQLCRVFLFRDSWHSGFLNKGRNKKLIYFKFYWEKLRTSDKINFWKEQSLFLYLSLSHRMSTNRESITIFWCGERVEIPFKENEVHVVPSFLPITKFKTRKLRFNKWMLLLKVEHLKSPQILISVNLSIRPQNVWISQTLR